MLGINTRRGDVAAGDNGLAALPDRVEEARGAIIEALDYAKAINADAVHVMAGVTSSPAARGTFIENLSFACAHAGERTILIEPLNPHDAPGYFLGNTQQAADIIAAVDQPRLKLMFDCYHVGRTDGDVCAKLTDLFPIIGHIQFAAVPDRGVPDHGEMNYAEVFAHLAKLGWDRPLGAEYKSDKPTDETLGWMRN